MPPTQALIDAGNKMKPEHEAFALAVAGGSTVTDAYLEYVSEESKDEDTGRRTASVNGSKLARRPDIAAMITRLREEANAVIAARRMMTREEALAHLSANVRTPLQEIHEGSPLAVEIEYDGDGNVSKVKKERPSASIAQMAAMCGWNKPEQRQVIVTVHPDVSKAIDEFFDEP